jgi:hypothetical protein
MPRILAPQLPKKIIFGDLSASSIIGHKTRDGFVTFVYRLPVIVDPAVDLAPRSQVRVSVLKTQKKPRPITVTDNELLRGTIYRNVRIRKKQQLADNNDSIKLGSIQYLSPADILSGIVSIDVEISAADIGQSFKILIDGIDEKGLVTNYDTDVIDHQYFLSLYDIPKDDFIVRVGFYDKNTAAISAISRDDKIGSFNFFTKNAAPNSFDESPFILVGNESVDQYGNATLDIDISQNQKYIVAVSPVSKFTNFEMSNTKIFTFGVDHQDLQLGFYIKNISDDQINFSVSNLTNRLKKVLLYRQVYGSNERKLIDYAEISPANLGADLEDVDRLIHVDSVYTLMYIDDQSVMKTSPTQIFMPALKLNTLATVTSEIITGSINNGRADFNVSIDYNTSTTYDQIVQDLKSLGLDNLLETDLQKMTNNLKPITRVLASRINTITGIEENLGVHQPGQINLPHDYNQIYRFEAAVRSTPEVLENLASSQNLLANLSRDSKDPIDVASKLIGTNARFDQTSFSAKFFSKNSLQSSILKYGKATDGYDLGYYAGRTGITSDVVVGKITNAITINDVTINRISRDESLITWSWSYSDNVERNVSFKLAIGDRVEHALVTPTTQVATYYVKTTGLSSILIIPVIDGDEASEITKKVELT